MRNPLTATIAFVCLTGTAAAQAPPPAPLQTPNPTYATVDMEIDVNRPAADVWKRIGKYCDIGEWFQIRHPCTITSGKDGEFGAVSSVVNEILVGKDRAVVHIHAARSRRAALQHVSRHARGATGDGDDVEDRVHVVLRQLESPGDAAKQADKRSATHAVHARTAEHEDPRGRRHPAAAASTRPVIASGGILDQRTAKPDAGTNSLLVFVPGSPSSMWPPAGRLSLDVP